MSSGPDTHLRLALWVSLFVALLLSSMLLYTLVHRLYQTWAEGRLARRRARHADSLLLLAAGEESALAFARRVRKGDHRLAEEMLLELAEKFTGDVRTNLRDAFVALGAVQRNRKRLRSRLWWRRADAARRLGLIGDLDAVRVLRKLLRDSHFEVRLAVGRALLELGAKDWTDDLIRSLASRSRFSTLRLADVIMGAGAQAIPSLIRYVETAPSTPGLAVAAEVLGDLRAVEAEPALISLLYSPSVDVRAAACRALGRLETPAATEALCHRLQYDEAWVVRSQAVRALGQIGDPQSIPAISPLLSEQNPWAVYNAAVALAALGPQGHAILQRVAQEDGESGGETSLPASVRKQVVAEVLLGAGGGRPD